MKEGDIPVLLELRFCRRQEEHESTPIVWGVLRLDGAGGMASVQGQPLSRGTAVSSAPAAGTRQELPGQ